MLPRRPKRPRVVSDPIRFGIPNKKLQGMRIFFMDDVGGEFFFPMLGGYMMQFEEHIGQMGCETSNWMMIVFLI